MIPIILYIVTLAICRFLSLLFCLGTENNPPKHHLTEFFKASRSLCFDAGRGCLVIANLLGMPEFHPYPIDGRTDERWMKGNAWFDDFFFPGKKRTTTFTFPAKVFLRSLGVER